MASQEIRIFGPDDLPVGPTTYYTCPADSRTVMRHLHVSNPQSHPVSISMSIGADAYGTRLFDSYVVPPTSVYDWYPIAVIEAGETIQLSTSLANELVAYAGGTLYTLG